jgi:hypothetical protein
MSTTGWFKTIIGILSKTKARLLKWLILDRFVNILRIAPGGSVVADLLDGYLTRIVRGLDYG